MEYHKYFKKFKKLKKNKVTSFDIPKSMKILEFRNSSQTKNVLHHLIIDRRLKIQKKTINYKTATEKKNGQKENDEIFYEIDVFSQ